jgi:hypothetical protein
MPLRTKQKYPFGKRNPLRRDPDNGKIATNGPYISESDSERRVKKRPRAAVATSNLSDSEISENSSDNPAETFSPSLAKLKAIQDDLELIIKKVAELERELSLQEEEQEE